MPSPPRLHRPLGGRGLEGWEERYLSQGRREAVSLRSLQATFGGGWVFHLGRGFTVNPWGALHQRIAGDRKVQTPSAACHPKPWTAEVSVKVGYTW